MTDSRFKYGTMHNFISHWGRWSTVKDGTFLDTWMYDADSPEVQARWWWCNNLETLNGEITLLDVYYTRNKKYICIRMVTSFY